MKKLRLSFVLILITLLNCQSGYTARFKLRANRYYSLSTDLETTITKWDGEFLSLKIDAADNLEQSPYPLGSEFLGRVVKRREAKRFYRDEYIMVQVEGVKFPNGLIQAEDLKFKIHPRPMFFNKEKIATTTIMVTAVTLGTIFDATIVGLPVSRGSYAVMYSALEIKNRKPDSSRLKAGLIGFSKGALFPIPQMLSKGDDLAKMTLGSRISLDREKHGKSIDAYLKA